VFGKPDRDEPAVDYPKPSKWEGLVAQIKTKAAKVPVLVRSDFALVYLGIALIIFNRPLGYLLGISSRFSILIGILAFLPTIFPRVSGLMTARLARVSHYENFEAEAKDELNKAIADINGIDDLPGLMLANKKQMDAYEALVRSQRESSHRASLIAMAASFCAVGAGLLVAVLSEDSATKYAAAAMAAAGAAAGGYIARTFIRAQQSAQDQMRFHVQQPLVQSYLLAAERIISMMSADVRDDQYKRILRSALAQAENVSCPRNVTEVDRSARRRPKMKLPRVGNGADG
jgi:hypothetical protein